MAVSRSSALTILDGGVPPAGLPPAAAAVARGWGDALELLQTLAAEPAPLAVDAGLLRALHWTLHRRWPVSRPGQLRTGSVVPVLDPTSADDPVAAALSFADEVRRADLFWAENASLAYAVELLLLSRADGVPVVAAGRPTTVGNPADVLAAAAEAHRQRLIEAEQRWFDVSRELGGRGLTDRMTGPCWDAAAGAVLTNAGYRTAVELVQRRRINEQQASRDLRSLVAHGMLRATGTTRDRAYRWNR